MMRRKETGTNSGKGGGGGGGGGGVGNSGKSIKNRPSLASTSTSSRRKRSDSARRRQHEDLGVEPIDQNKSKPRIIKGLHRIRKTNNNAKDKDKERTVEDTTGATGTGSTYNTNNGATRDGFDRDKPASPEQKQCFEEFTRDAVNKGVKGVLDEYATHLKSYIPGGVTRIAFDANPKKNRYSDVVCVDASRVILKNHPTDYIHANFVRGDPLLNTFICTQGPMMNSIKDFWKMVAQERVENIIMLCDTVEQGKEKCQQYWPREQGCAVEWPGIQVKNIKIDNSDSTTLVSTLELIFDKKEKIILKHHHWRTWPDKSVPQSVLSPFRLLKNVRHSNRPTIVHCSAGIGRTGSVVALELCYQQILSENRLSVLESVKALRSQRMHSVQTELQYLYLYKCLLTFSQRSRTIPQDCQPAFDAFEKDYQTLMEENLAAEKNEAYAPLTPMRFCKK